MGFGQALIWLNYRYYIAIMLFFIAFGAAGVVFYRLLTAVIEQQNGCALDVNSNAEASSSQTQDNEGAEHQEQTVQSTDSSSTTAQTHNHSSSISSGCNNYNALLFYLDWLPVRITSFGYMFVGHFSKALPMWLESLFDGNKPTHQILIDVAQKSEDIMVDENDCTAEPCLLVRLAKRTVLLLLATISVLTIMGVFI